MENLPKGVFLKQKKGVNMKRYLFPFLATVLVALTPMSTSGAESPKFGIVDLQRCIRDSIEGKRVYDKLKKSKDALQKKLDKSQDELLKLKEELDKQGMMLSVDAKEDKEKEFERKRREFKYFYDDLTEEMRKEEAEARKEILMKLEKVVSAIGEKGKYLMIFERRSSGIMYGDKAVDITDEVVKAFDKESRK
jgi:outer membrane protein